MGLDTFKKPATWTKLIAIICFVFCSFIVTEYTFYVSDLSAHGVNNFLQLAASAAIPVFIILVALRIAGKAAPGSLEGSLSIVWCIYAVVALIFCLLGRVGAYHYNYLDRDKDDKELMIKIIAAVFFLVAAIALVLDSVMSLKNGGGGGGGGGD